MSVYAGPNVIQNGLVLHLDASNRRSYPGTGTVWRDLSGRNNHGTLTNGPTYSSANGGSIVFDGVNDRIDISNFAANTTSTMSFWIKFFSSGGTFNRIYSTGPNDNFEIGINGSGALAHFPTSGGWASLNSSLSLNVWENLTFTLSGGILNLYKNASLLFAINNSTASLGSYISLAARYSGGESINCQISTLQIYNRALSASEIAQNFNATRGRFGL